VLGTAGGPLFGSRVQTLARKQEVSDEALAAACGIGLSDLQEIFLGTRRVGISALARMMRALRSRPVEFMQATGMLSEDVYAGGLDPLYFLPQNSIRYEARIYMREINPRHAVPEADMTKRNPTLAAVMNDSLLDELGKAELELAYLLRTAVQNTGGTL
jgi:transcriptional regulator with XRE-family HTH domain